MAEYIDSNTLSKLRAISILEVADELGMGLRYHNTLCISHNDTHPSLHFWTSTNTCHCFACGWGGDNIDLVMKRENLSFRRLANGCAEDSISAPVIILRETVRMCFIGIKLLLGIENLNVIRTDSISEASFSISLT